MRSSKQRRKLIIFLLRPRHYAYLCDTNRNQQCVCRSVPSVRAFILAALDKIILVIILHFDHVGPFNDEFSFLILFTLLIRVYLIVKNNLASYVSPAYSPHAGFAVDITHLVQASHHYLVLLRPDEYVHSASEFSENDLPYILLNK